MNEMLAVQIINYLKNNIEVSLADMTFVCRASKSDVLSVCMEHDRIESRHMYVPGGRITLYKYTQFPTNTRLPTLSLL